MALHEKSVPKASLGGSKKLGVPIKTSSLKPTGQDPMKLPRKVRYTGSTR